MTRPVVVDEPVELDGELLAPRAVKQHLEQTPSHGGRVFCSYQKLGTDPGKAYLWAVCDEFRDARRLARTTNTPVVIGRDWDGSSHGSLSPAAAKRMVPERLWRLLDRDDERVATLAAANQAAAIRATRIPDEPERQDPMPPR